MGDELIPRLEIQEGSRAKILVVDDEAGISRMLQLILERAGFTTAVATSGPEALQVLRSDGVDLVLLDVMMPGMDGHSVLTQMRSDDQLRHLPVILVTARDLRQDKVAGLELGADDYITKPFDNEELIARVRGLLRSKSVPREILRSHRELSLLNALADVTGRSLDLATMVAEVLRWAGDLLGAEGGLIQLRESADREMVLKGSRGLPLEFLRSRITLPVGGITEWIYAEEKKGTTGMVAAWGSLPEGEFRSWTGIPLLAQSQFVGVLQLFGREPKRFSAEMVPFLTAIGRQVGTAMDNARLHAAVQEQARRMAFLAEASGLFVSCPTLESLLTTVVQVSSRVLGDTCGITLVEGIHKVSTPATIHYRESTPIRNVVDFLTLHSAQSEEGPGTAVAATGMPLLLRYMAEYHGPHRALFTSLGVSAYLAVPIRARGQILGVLSSSQVHPGATFTEDHLQWAQALADQAAMAIDNALLLEEAKRLAIRDELTSLYNRRHFYRQMEAEARRSVRYHHHLSLLLVDLDCFKEFNDRRGHVAGDRLLRRIAEVLLANAREVDTVARYGGDEFAVVLPETSLEQAWIQAERIRSAVEKISLPEALEGEGPVTVSVGITALDPEGAAVEDLVQRADEALYHAKTVGRNRVSSVPECRPGTTA